MDVCTLKIVGYNFSVKTVIFIVYAKTIIAFELNTLSVHITPSKKVIPPHSCNQLYTIYRYLFSFDFTLIFTFVVKKKKGIYTTKLL